MKNIEQIKSQLILLHYPTILTKDGKWVQSIINNKMENEGRILTLPNDAIIVVHKEDQDTIRMFNKPMFIVKD